MEYAAIAATVLLYFWLLLSDFGLPAAPWLEASMLGRMPMSR